jgi:transposase-like protein
VPPRRREPLAVDEPYVKVAGQRQYAWHRTDPYANNRIEADHGRLEAAGGEAVVIRTCPVDATRSGHGNAQRSHSMMEARTTPAR